MNTSSGFQPDWPSAARLWLVLDMAAALPRSLVDVTRLAVSGGVDAVVCRIRNQSQEVLFRESTAVREACRELRVPFIMSHNPELAAELNADGIQIGISDPDITVIRKVIGSRMVIGYSTHGVQEAYRCFDEGADYVFLGPIFPTPEKLKYGDPIGPATVVQPSAEAGDAVDIGDIVNRGARRIAVISAIQRTPDPASSSTDLKRYLV